MRITRLRDRSLVFESSWAALRLAWRAAAQTDKVILDDGRPAVVLHGDDRPPAPEGEAEAPLGAAPAGRSYQTVPPVIWEQIRAQERLRVQPLDVAIAHPKRGRLCSTCGAEMKMSREYGMTWSLICPICRSVEVLGKDQPGVGGTIGAGEVEKT